MTAILLTLDIADRNKWPVLYLCIGQWWNVLWGCLQQGKQCNWLCRGKPIWAAALLQDTAVRKSASANATEKHQNNQQMDQADKIEMAQVDLDWWIIYRTVGPWHPWPSRKKETHLQRWTSDHRVALAWTLLHSLCMSMERCCDQASQMVKFSLVWGTMAEILVCRGMLDWLSNSCKPAKGSTMCLQRWKQPPYGWKQYPTSHVAAQNTFLGPWKQASWQHGTTETIESDNWTNFWNNLIDTWSKGHGIEWLHHNPYHTSVSRKIKL